MSSLAVGKLTKRLKSPDGSEIDQWRMTLPYSAYLYDFAIGKFATIKMKQHGFQLTYVSEIATAEELQKDFGETSAMVQFLSEKAGAGLPSGRYAQLLVPGREAQEAATYSIIGKDYLDPKIDWVIVHELSHQWWGNLIASPGYHDDWIMEALANVPTTAHILGGAVIAADAEHGVVDARQHAFGYENLLVCDGAAVPANVGVNPSLTITALAEHAMAGIPDRALVASR